MERTLLTSLFVITDSENGHFCIGDIDGGTFDMEMLEEHIKNHGADGIFRQIAWMNCQVFTAMRNINAKKNEKEIVSSLFEISKQ